MNALENAISAANPFSLPEASTGAPIAVADGAINGNAPSADPALRERAYDTLPADLPFPIN
jgi:hypothetical protein